MDEGKVMAAASFEKQKYYLAEDFEGLPPMVKKEVKAICAVTAEKLSCGIVIGFDKEGELYIQTITEKDPIGFDEIGSALEIKKITMENRELFEQLELWYKLIGSKINNNKRNKEGN